MSLVSLMPPATTPAERFARIIAMMVGMIGARLERPGKPGLAGPLTAAIHIRLIGIRNRLARYAARFQAGTLAPPRPRPATPRPRKARGPGKWDDLPKLPRGRMWLVRLVPGIGVGANHLRLLLEEPEMQAMLEAAPQIGRTLRPFWHMLSKDPLPPALQPARPVGKPAPPSAAPLTAGNGRPPPAEPSRTAPSQPAPAVAGPECGPPTRKIA